MSKPQRVVAAGLALAKPVYGRGGIRHGGGLNLPRGGRAERGNLGLRCERRSHKWKNHEGESTEAEPRGGTTRSSKEVPETGWSEGVVSGSLDSMSQPAMGGADERGKAVLYFQVGGLGGVQTSKGEPGSGRGRRRDDCGLRKEPEREPV